MKTKKTQKKLLKEDILTTPARQTLFNNLMQNFNIVESAKKAKLSYQYARQLVTKGHINALVRQEKAILQQEIKEKLVINEETQIKRLRYLSEMGVRYRQLGPSVSAEKEIATICGLHAADNAQKDNKVPTVVIIGNARPSKIKVESSTKEHKCAESNVIEDDKSRVTLDNGLKTGA